MVGDGLNDAGALAAADVGLAVSDDTACVVPACDGVIGGDRLARSAGVPSLRPPRPAPRRRLLRRLGRLQRRRADARTDRRADAAGVGDPHAGQLADHRRPQLGGDAVVGAQDAAGMSVIVLLIAAGGTVAAGFLVAFVWAVRSGQFDDTCTPPLRMLLDDDRPSTIVSMPSKVLHDVNRTR